MIGIASCTWYLSSLKVNMFTTVSHGSRGRSIAAPFEPLQSTFHLTILFPAVKRSNPYRLIRRNAAFHTAHYLLATLRERRHEDDLHLHHARCSRLVLFVQR